MSLVKLGLSDKPNADLVISSETVVAKMTGNANYTTPNPTLAFIAGLIAAFKTAIENALDGGKALKAIQAQKRKDLLTGMGLLAAYVQFASGGDATKISSSGMGVRNSRTPAALPSMILGVKAFTGEVFGTVQLSWIAQKGIKCYVIEYTTAADPAAGWVHLCACSSSRFVASNLPRNTKVWIRIAAINSAGQGGFSDPVHVYVNG